jgi:hypothetical protein
MLILPECFSFIGTSQQEVRGTAQLCWKILSTPSSAACLPAVISKGRAFGRPCYGEIQAACKVSCLAISCS